MDFYGYEVPLLPPDDYGNCVTKNVGAPGFRVGLFEVFAFISAGVGVVHMLGEERITRNPRAREPVGNCSTAIISSAAMRLPS
jgi:hypothetical protein